MSHSEMAQPPRDDNATDDDEPDALRLRMARAVEANWCAAWASLGRLSTQPHSLVDDSPTMLRVLTPGLAETLMNIVMRYRSPDPVTADALEAAIEPFRSYGLPFQWWLTRERSRKDFASDLRELGMQSWGGATSMTLSLAGWRPTYPSVEGAGVCALAMPPPLKNSRALQIICAVFFVPREPMARWTTENPATQMYIAYLDGRRGLRTGYYAARRGRGSVPRCHAAFCPQARHRRQPHHTGAP